MAIRRRLRGAGGRTALPSRAVRKATFESKLARIREMSTRIGGPSAAPKSPSPQANTEVAQQAEVLSPNQTSEAVAALLRRARRVNAASEMAVPAGGASIRDARQHVLRSMQEARIRIVGAGEILRSASDESQEAAREEMHQNELQERYRQNAVETAHHAAAEAQRLAEMATAAVALTSEVLDKAAASADADVKTRLASILARSEQTARQHLTRRPSLSRQDPPQARGDASSE